MLRFQRADQLWVILKYHYIKIGIEVEDRAYEGSLDSRKGSLRQIAHYLKQFIP